MNNMNELEYNNYLKKLALTFAEMQPYNVTSLGQLIDLSGLSDIYEANVLLKDLKEYLKTKSIQIKEDDFCIPMTIINSPIHRLKCNESKKVLDALSNMTEHAIYRDSIILVTMKDKDTILLDYDATSKWYYLDDKRIKEEMLLQPMLFSDYVIKLKAQGGKFFNYATFLASYNKIPVEKYTYYTKEEVQKREEQEEC